MKKNFFKIVLYQMVLVAMVLGIFFISLVSYLMSAIISTIAILVCAFSMIRGDWDFVCTAFATLIACGIGVVVLVGAGVGVICGADPTFVAIAIFALSCSYISVMAASELESRRSYPFQDCPCGCKPHFAAGSGISDWVWECLCILHFCAILIPMLIASW